jgi:hypothetical protein
LEAMVSPTMPVPSCDPHDGSPLRDASSRWMTL